MKKRGLVLSVTAIAMAAGLKMCIRDSKKGVCHGGGHLFHMVRPVLGRRAWAAVLHTFYINYTIL